LLTSRIGLARALPPKFDLSRSACSSSGTQLEQSVGFGENRSCENRSVTTTNYDNFKDGVRSYFATIVAGALLV
jgi:hypothetical protein